MKAYIAHKIYSHSMNSEYINLLPQLNNAIVLSVAYACSACLYIAIPYLEKVVIVFISFVHTSMNTILCRISANCQILDNLTTTIIINFNIFMIPHS